MAQNNEDQEIYDSLFENPTPDDIRKWAKAESDYASNKSGMITLLIMIIILFCIAFFYNFKSDYEYGWAWALFLHHWIIIPEWILSLFMDGKTCKPELYTTGYNIFWWIGMISWAVTYIYRTIAFIVYLFTRKHLVGVLGAFQRYKAAHPDEVAAALAEQQEQ